VLLADEPTGNLDEATGAGILDTLCELNHADGLSIVLVTHDTAVARRADRIVRLAAGRVDDAPQVLDQSAHAGQAARRKAG
jgi:putative ABC transport system ATP-binding protein